MEPLGLLEETIGGVVKGTISISQNARRNCVTRSAWRRVPGWVRDGKRIGVCTYSNSLGI